MDRCSAKTVHKENGTELQSNFRTARAYEAVQGLTDLSRRSLQIDDVQDFDVRWDHALLTVSEMPSLAILEGLCKSKLQNSVQPQTVRSGRCTKQLDTELSAIQHRCKTSY